MEGTSTAYEASRQSLMDAKNEANFMPISRWCCLAADYDM